VIFTDCGLPNILAQFQVERRLLAALQGASSFNVSKLSYINPTMNDDKLLKVAGLFVQNRDVIKNIQGGLR